MAEPESHTLRMLQEMRAELHGFRTEAHNDFDSVRREMIEGFTHLNERVEHLARLVSGESVLGRYAAGGVDERLQELEKRVASLEERR
jgi:polyhydroxyalkanoate synthesis regulator phasin